MPRPPTGLTLIARHLGTTAATISRALRNDPRISAATCARAQAVATEFGYRPDPETQRLMARLRATREVRFVATLGLINDGARRPDLYRDPYTAAVIRGAAARAAELGYRLDELHVRERGMTAERLENICRTRGMRGVLLPPQSLLREDIPLPYHDLAVVAATAARPELPLHRVSPDHFANLTTLLEQLIQLGHTRVGLITSADMEARQRHAPSSVFHWFVRQVRQLAPLPPLDADRKLHTVAEWLQRHRPTAILAPDGWVLDHLEPHARVPADLSLVIYGNRRPGISGIDELPEAIGAAALDLLTSCVQRGEKNLPDHPKRMLIAGRYVPGKTTLVHHKTG